MTGTIKRLVSDRGFGFVSGDDGVEYFFHKSQATDFDAMNDGDRAQFEVEPDAPKGPRASDVQRLTETPVVAEARAAED